MNQDLPRISVVLPVKGLPKVVSDTLDALARQTLLPSEILVIDSSINNDLVTEIEKHKKKLNIEHIKIKKAYPGEARNIGIEKCSYEIVAFVDSKTVPAENWLELSFDQIKSGFDISFGKTQYLALTPIQKIFQATTYGINPVETLPGTMLRRSTLNKVGNFIEEIRSSEDLEWRSRCRNLDFKIFVPEGAQLSYSQMSKTILQEFKKQFTYQLHTAYCDVQLKQKTMVFGLILILVTFLIPQWNALVGWEESIFYIPNISKSFFYLLSFFSMILLIQNILKNEITILFKFMLGVFFLMSSYLVYQWNFVMAEWVEQSIFYIPHITKIYFSIIIFLAVLFRGIYKPITMGIQNKYIFPIRWLLVGFIGVLLDLARVPGYLLGALIALKK